MKYAIQKIKLTDRQCLMFIFQATQLAYDILDLRNGFRLTTSLVGTSQKFPYQHYPLTLYSPSMRRATLLRCFPTSEKFKSLSSANKVSELAN